MLFGFEHSPRVFLWWDILKDLLHKTCQSGHLNGSKSFLFLNDEQCHARAVITQNMHAGCFTCGRRSRIAMPVAASLSRKASKGLTATMGAMGRGTLTKPTSSSVIMDKRLRPSPCDSNSNSESKRRIKLPRLLQSSCNSYLQYISTRGRSCVHVVRIAWWEGKGKPACRRQTSRPVRTKII